MTPGCEFLVIKDYLLSGLRRCFGHKRDVSGTKNPLLFKGGTQELSGPVLTKSLKRNGRLEVLQKSVTRQDFEFLHKKKYEIAFPIFTSISVQC